MYFIFPSGTVLSKRTSILTYSMPTVNIYSILLPIGWLVFCIADVLTQLNSEATFLTVLE